MTDPIAYLRDLDGTGSLHPCGKEDEGAIAVYAIPPTVHVIMSNDFPSAVIADEVEAQKLCDDAMEAQVEQYRKEHPGCREESARLFGRRIYWRSYPFEVQ